MKHTAVRGTKDVLPPESARTAALEKAAREIFSLYGYSEIRTPTFEQVELFSRSIGDTSDIVEKEMYVFEDRGGRKLALRPEGTAGVVRAYVEHNLNQKSAFAKLFYMGSMFRAERPQAGRYREFSQIGAEYFGNASALAEAETIRMVLRLFDHLKIENVAVPWNNLGCSNCRPAYRKALLEFLSKSKDSLCEDCQRRLEKNPLRALDCKIDGERIGREAPQMSSFLCEDCRKHSQDFVRFWAGESRAVSSEPNNRLVRGLDYYNRIVFEFITPDGLALAAGGRYDSLVKSLGGPDVPAVGFALGVERVLAAAPAADLSETVKVFVAVESKELAPDALAILEELRASGISSVGGYADKSLKAQMRLADASGARFVVIAGTREKEQGKVALRDMTAQSQKEIPRNQILASVR